MERMNKFNTKKSTIDYLKENGKIVGKELHLSENVRTEHGGNHELKEKKTVPCSKLETRAPEVVSYFK